MKFIVIVAIALAGAGLYLMQLNNASAATILPVSKSGKNVKAEYWSSDAELQETEFWIIIERTRNASSRQNEQLEKLRDELEKLHLNDLEKFIHVFDRLMFQTYRWDLWGAVYVIQGGASDDSFQDFRKWLISQGEVVFKHAVSDPDSLADEIDPDFEGEVTFEEFSYVLSEVWSEKSGKEISELKMDEKFANPTEPKGEHFEDDIEHLSNRYPKLWGRFGMNPLG